MARLYLVRHGQASFAADNYDVLSAKGKKQAEYLRYFFEHTGVQAVYCGELERQKETAAIGFPDHTATVVPGLNEYDHNNLLEVYKPEWREREKIAAYLMSQPDPKKAMQLIFEEGMKMWAREHDHPEYTETWPVFQQRCGDALQLVIDESLEAGNKEVAVVTSGGYIAAVVGQILGLTPQKVMEVNWVMANASVTGLLFDGERVSVSFLNNFSHLPKELVSYR